jgi:predicted nuclease of predicted toxin-antitoxin system
MNAKKRKSTKRFAASSNPQLSDLVLYLDRNLGRHLLAGKLRAAGYLVQVHDDHLPQNAPDEEWISLVARKRWIAITKDKNIRYRFAELAAIKKYKAGVLVIRAKNTTADDIAELLIKAKKRLEKYVTSTAKPFVAGNDRYGKIVAYKL